MLPKDVIERTLRQKVYVGDGPPGEAEFAAEQIIAELKKYGWEIKSADNRHRVGGVS